MVDCFELINAGREGASLEYKRSADWGDLRLGVIRTVLGMANTRDGGSIVIGVEEQNGRFTPSGVAPDHLARFPTEEDLQAAVNGFAEPFVAVLLDRCEDDGRTFLVISVPEFASEPVLCRKSEGQRLREGALYIRSARKPETTEVRTPTDMRELIRLATEKAVESRFKELSRAGVRFELPGAATREAEFRSELGEL